jgi:hypothetical protein
MRRPRSSCFIGRACHRVRRVRRGRRSRSWQRRQVVKRPEAALEDIEKLSRAGVPVTEVAERFGVSRQACTAGSAGSGTRVWTVWGSFAPAARASGADQAGGGGGDLRAAPGASAVAAAAHRARAGPHRLPRPNRVGVHDLPGAGAARPGRREPAPPAPTGLQALAAGPTMERARAAARAAARLLPGRAVIATQRIHVGIVHAGRTLAVEAADTTWRIYDQHGVVAEVARRPRPSPSPDSGSTNPNHHAARTRPAPA